MGLVGQLFLFSIGIMIFLATMIMMNLSGNQSFFDQRVEAEVNAQAAAIEQNAVMTSVLDDYMWRVEDKEYNDGEIEVKDIEYKKYRKIKAKKLISLYYSASDPSTTEGEVWIKEKKYKADSIRPDLRNYLRYKMEENWVNRRSEEASYSISVGSRNSPVEPIEVQNGDVSSSYQVSYQLPKTAGEKIFITMRTDKTVGGFGVERDNG